MRSVRSVPLILWIQLQLCLPMPTVADISSIAYKSCMFAPPNMDDPYSLLHTIDLL
jgi:hypothetical protein